MRTRKCIARRRKSRRLRSRAPGTVRHQRLVLGAWRLRATVSIVKHLTRKWALRAWVWIFRFSGAGFQAGMSKIGFVAKIGVGP